MIIKTYQCPKQNYVVLIISTGLLIFFLSSLAVALLFWIIIPLWLVYVALRLYRDSYKLAITDDGKLIETQFLRRQSELHISEVEIIKMSKYIDPISLFGIASWMPIMSPRLYNKKYRKFPRYFTPFEIVETLKNIRPDILVEPKLAEHFELMYSPKARKVTKAAMGIIWTIAIVSISIAVYYLIHAIVLSERVG